MDLCVATTEVRRCTKTVAVEVFWTRGSEKREGGMCVGIEEGPVSLSLRGKTGVESSVRRSNREQSFES